MLCHLPCDIQTKLLSHQTYSFSTIYIYTFQLRNLITLHVIIEIILISMMFTNVKLHLQLKLMLMTNDRDTMTYISLICSL